MLFILLFLMMTLFNSFSFLFLMVFFMFFMCYNKNIFFFDFFLLDFLSISMLFMLTLISMVILNYNKMYFPHEISSKKFNIYILLFIVVMFMFTTCINFIFLYIFWEFVGILSFILINWWKQRKKSLSASFSTIFFNRCGDFFFFFIMSMMSTSHSSSTFFFFENSFFFSIIVFSIMAKSALFFFHPWLPLAMESPTPVSSLLHSSTMVVASVFMYMRLANMVDLVFTNIIIIISSITFLWSGFSSFNQKDMKKIIAYSTMSQMGFIVMTSSMLSMKISFFILICHGFFKSMLFMCSGVFIHTSLNIQNKSFSFFSKMSNPMTHYIYFFSVMSLMGLPFFTSYIYKHIVFENLLSSIMNTLCLVSFYMGSMFTIMYSLMLVDSSFLKSLKLNSMLPTENMNSFFFYIFFLLFMGFFSSFVLSFFDKSMLYNHIFFYNYYNFLFFMLVFSLGIFFFFMVKTSNKHTGESGFFFNFFFMNYMLKKNFFLMNYMLLIENFFFENFLYYLYSNLNLKIIKMNFKMIMLLVSLSTLYIIFTFLESFFEVFHF